MSQAPSLLEQLTRIKPAGAINLKDRKIDRDDLEVLRAIGKGPQHGVTQADIEREIPGKPSIARVDDLVRAGLVYEDAIRLGPNHEPTFRKTLTVKGKELLDKWLAGGMKGAPPPPKVTLGDSLSDLKASDDVQLPPHLKA